MSNFSKNIAEYAQLYAPEFEIQVVSPIVAQAILETGNGVDANAQVKVANHNVFGIKYNHKDPDRVSSHSHFFADGGWEVVDGIREELDPNTSYWYGFADIEQCIIGYFEFIQKSWYTPLKECTTALEYCHAIKECGYATDPDYTTKLLSIIERYELSQYDVKTESEEHEMSNETVNIKETNLSFSTLTTRTATTRIFLHHAAATTCGAETIHTWHKNQGWSGIGYHFVVRKDGTIERGRPEDKVGAHTSGHNSDSIGICFEGNFESETMNEAQKQAGTNLVAYVKSLYKVDNVYQHKDVAATACAGANFPFEDIVGGTISTDKVEDKAEEKEDTDITHTVTVGDTLSKIADQYGVTVDALASINLIEDVNKIYVGQVIKIQQSTDFYLVKVTSNSLNIRAGAGTSYNVTGTIADQGIYTVVETLGNWGRLKSGMGWINLTYTEKA